MTALAALLTLATLAQPAPDRSDSEARPAPASVIPPKLIEAPKGLEGVPARRDLGRTLVVMLTIDTEGRASDVTIERGLGEPWDSLVVRAIEAARFAPATRAGEPVAVRIRWPVELPYSVTPRGLDRRAPEPTPTVGDAFIAGRLTERGTRTPLVGVAVILDDGALSAVTDEDGNFRFDNLVPRRYKLFVPPAEHAPIERVVRAPTDLGTLRLQRTGRRDYGTVVLAPSNDASRVVVPVERAREIPGNSGDPVKVVEVLPGAARPASAGPAAGQLVVRGSAPEDTLFYIDGMPLFQLYHFGNVYSVIQDEFVGDVDFRPGGFSSEYGDATGGWLGVSLAQLPTDGPHGNVDINIYHAATLITVPVSDAWTVGGSFRRSYIDAILPAVIPEDSGFAFTAAPRYYEYQVRADYVPSPRVNLRLIVFGSDDDLAAILDDPSDDDPTSQGFSLYRSFHQIQGRLDWTLTDDLTLELGLATSYQRLNIKPSTRTEFDLTFDPVTLKATADYRVSDRVRLRVGNWSTVTRFKVDATLPPPTKEGAVPSPISSQPPIEALTDGFETQLALWSELIWDVSDPVRLTFGYRSELYLGDHDSAISVDPRVVARWSPGERTSLTLAAGLYSQAPAPDEWSESFGTTTLGLERAVQTSVGWSQRWTDWLNIDLTVFYKHLFDLVTPNDEFGGDVYTNEGSGSVIGGEALIRVRADILDSWIAYTISRSRRVDAPGEPERPFSFDQTHVLSLVAGLDLGSGWRAGLRFRYTTGNPFTPLTSAYYDSRADVYVPRAAAAPLSQRVDDFIALDLRIAKTWTFETWQLEWYLELNNATNRQNVEFVSYTYDYSERQDVTGLPITPSLGLRAKF